MSSRTIVEYFAGESGNRCGYCRNEFTSLSNGMWAHRMTVQDYQDLIDRGWRRSGKYVYKPTMDKTCCPQYTIKCAAGDFKLSKSHKKVIKHFNRYINTDVGKSEKYKSLNSAEEFHDISDVPAERMTRDNEEDATTGEIDLSRLQESSNEEQLGMKPPMGSSAHMTGVIDQSSSSSASKDSSSREHERTTEVENTAPKKVPKPGLGADPNRPMCMKAKDRRKERWRQKHGLTDGETAQAKSSKTNNAKTLEELLNEIENNSKHKFEVRLVRSSPRSEEFRATFEESYKVYHKYQMVIHGDPPEKPSQRQYTNFLVDSPLQPYHREGGFADGFGSFHQHYLIDGKIIAVGVIDILPTCVSSVYLYYDPDYFFLSLGTYSALQELAFTRQLTVSEPSIVSYYMGFYIHSCPKMRYKGQYVPSFILCPETYKWIPIEQCRPKLDEKKYSRLEESPNEKDPESDLELGKVLVLYERQAMPYQFYAFLNAESEDEAEVLQYAALVGKTCAERMILVRS